MAPPSALTTHLSANQIALLLGGDESGPTRVTTVGSEAQRIAGKRARLDGRRVGVLHPEPGAADTLAQTLRQRGAQVAVLSLDPRQLARVEALEPEVIIVEPKHFTGVCWEPLRAVFEHPQLRWTCVLVSTPELVAVDGLEEHDLAELSAHIQLLCGDYDAAVARVKCADKFDVALDALGPARVLRLLVESGKSWRVQIATSTLTMEVDVAQDLIVGARGAYGTSTDHTLLGTDALNVLLREVQGTVLAHAVERPAVTNIMCPLDAALANAQHGRVATGSSLPRASFAAKPSLAAKPSSPSPTEQSAGALSLVSRTLVGLPGKAARSLAPSGRSPSPTGRSLPPTPAAALSVINAALSQASGAHIMPTPPQADNDNATAPTVQRTSLPAATHVAAPKPSTAVSTTTAPPQRPSARDEETVELGAKSLRKPLAALVTATLVAVGLLTLSEPSPKPSAEARAKAAEAASKPAAALGAVAGSAPVAPEPSTPVAPVVVPSVTPAPTTAMPVAEAPAEVAPPEAARAELEHAPSVAPSSAPLPAVEETTTATPLAVEAPQTPALRPAAMRALARRAASFARQGKRLLREHKLDKAQLAYERALKAAPTDVTALGGQVQVALEQRDATRAVESAKTFTNLHPTSATAQLLLGDAQRLAADVPAARSAWKRALQLGQPLARARLRSLTKQGAHAAKGRSAPEQGADANEAAETAPGNAPDIGRTP